MRKQEIVLTTSPTVLESARKKDKPSEHQRRRWAGIIDGTATALASQAIAVVVGFLSVPLTIGYLGTEQYGIWLSIFTLTSWLQLSDLGIGNSLTNAISTALADDRRDIARTYVSTAFFTLIAAALLLGGLFASLCSLIDWAGIFGVQTAAAKAELLPALAMAVAIFCFQLPLQIIGKIYLGLQEGRISNYWRIAANIATLLALITVTKTHGGLEWLVAAVSGSGLVMLIINGVWLFGFHQPSISPTFRHVQLEQSRELSRTGIQFLFIQIVSLVLYQTDNILIAHYRGAAAVPIYSVTYKLFAYTYMIQTLANPYVWAAYTEAIARNDIGWVKRTFRSSLLLSLLTTTSLLVPLIFLARTITRMWAGEAAVPPFQLIPWMVAWAIISAFTNPISCLLSSASHLKALAIYSTVACFANVVLSIVLVQRWGICGVIAGTVISYAIFVCGPSLLDAKLLLNQLGRRLGNADGNQNKIEPRLPPIAPPMATTYNLSTSATPTPTSAGRV